MEDKELLQALKEIISPMESDIKDIKGRLGNVENDMKDVQGRLTNVENTVLKTNIVIENDIRKAIQMVAEGHKGLYEKLIYVPEEIEDIKDSVSILKFVQTEMAKKVRNIK